ncbi:kelch-like protein 17 [Halichondria panicea]|uniref:kelch-like protein 17 n=1 Tax=Halichondria panicea TaxID=6063 RepID=UPI00312B94E7
MSDTYLTIADLGKLYIATFDARVKWRNFLLVLEISSDTIDSIGTKWRDDPDDCYREGLKEWLKGGERSWEDVVKALSSPIVGHVHIARTIERDHLQSSNPTDVKSEDASLTRDSDSMEATKRDTQPIKKGPPPRELPLTLKWRRGKDMPIKIGYTVQSVVIGDTAYVGGGSADNYRNMCTVMKLEQDQWTKLPEYTAKWFGMTSLANRLVLVGGRDPKKNTPSNQLSVLESGEWTHPYPPMNIARQSSTAVSFNNHIIVAGGRDGDGRISSVEVLDVVSRRWYIAQSLPNSRSELKSTLIGNTLYLMGGYDHTGPTKTVHHVDLNELIAKALSNSDTPTLWQTLEEVPLELSAPLSIGRSLLAVGGANDRVNPSSSIHLYQPDTRRWLKVGDLPTVRYCCTCSVLPSGEVIVAGGQIVNKIKIQTVDFFSISS